jgi:hypothetical protein
MGDHSRFIFFSLAPTESEYILTAQDFIILFDRLLEQSHEQLAASELVELNREAYEVTYRLREFKLELLSMSLTSDLKSHLPPSFYNDMLNELDEYLFILNSLMNGQDIEMHPLHYHMLWLSDAIGHAASVASELDLVEKDLIDRACRYEMQFQDLHLKSLLMNGYLRTQLEKFPSLDRLNEQAGIAITNFMEFLDNIRDQRMNGRILGTLMPIMADHMSREECYYLWKLSEAANNISRPDCDPTRPRFES